MTTADSSSLGPGHRDVQLAATWVLREFDRACHELGIRYSVWAGTAIGAVRHQGFIPWDDDVDVCMPREDYERFLAEAPAVLGEELTLVSQRSAPDFPRSFAVLGLTGSRFVSQANQSQAVAVPVGLDIFPMDRLAADRRLYERQRRAIWLWGRALFLYGTPSAAVGLPGPLETLASGVFRAVHAGMHASGLSAAALYRRWEKAACRFNDTTSPVVADCANQDPLRWSARLDELFPTVRVPFEGIEVDLAHGYDAILTRIYGDYMTPPPPTEQVNHAALDVDLGPYWPPRR